MVTAMAWSKKSSPAIPLTKTRGMNTAQVVSTELSIGPATSFVPSTTASRRASPRSQREVMLSTRIIVLSAIIPTPSRRPDRDTILMDMPSTWKNTIETIRAEGMVRDTRAGERKSRMKRKITRQASTIPTTIFCTRLFIEYSRS